MSLFCFNKIRRVWFVDEFIVLCDIEYWCIIVLVYIIDIGYMYIIGFFVWVKYVLYIIK